MIRKVVLLALVAVVGFAIWFGFLETSRQIQIVDRTMGQAVQGAIAIAGPATKPTGVGAGGLFRANRRGFFELPGVFHEDETVLTVWAPEYKLTTMPLPAPATLEIRIQRIPIFSDPADGQDEIGELKRLLTRLEEIRAAAGGSFTYQEGITYEELKDELTTELEIATMLAEDYRESAELLDYSEPADGETSSEK